MKRVLVAGDTHCGHLAGLTPPDWWAGAGGGATKRGKLAAMQRDLWRQWNGILRALAPIDVVLWTGDMIDGKNPKWGGTEMLTSDREEQAEMACEVCREARRHGREGAQQVQVGVYGTRYHVGADGEDWENVIAEKSGWLKLGAHEWIDVDGCVFDLKHKLSTSSIPHGRATALLRQALWNALWHERSLVPEAQVLLRAHTHYFAYAGDGSRLCVSCPALQGFGSKYGTRLCEGTVDWGCLHFDVHENGSYQWAPHLVTVRAFRATALKV